MIPVSPLLVSSGHVIIFQSWPCSTAPPKQRGKLEKGSICEPDPVPPKAAIITDRDSVHHLLVIRSRAINVVGAALPLPDKK